MTFRSHKHLLFSQTPSFQRSTSPLSGERVHSIPHLRPRAQGGKFDYFLCDGNKAETEGNRRLQKRESGGRRRRKEKDGESRRLKRRCRRLRMAVSAAQDQRGGGARKAPRPSRTVRLSRIIRNSRLLRAFPTRSARRSLKSCSQVVKLFPKNPDPWRTEP